MLFLPVHFGYSVSFLHSVLFIFYSYFSLFCLSDSSLFYLFLSFICCMTVNMKCICSLILKPSYHNHFFFAILSSLLPSSYSYVVMGTGFLVGESYSRISGNLPFSFKMLQILLNSSFNNPLPAILRTLKLRNPKKWHILIGCSLFGKILY